MSVQTGRCRSEMRVILEGGWSDIKGMVPHFWLGLHFQSQTFSCNKKVKH